MCLGVAEERLPGRRLNQLPICADDLLVELYSETDYYSAWLMTGTNYWTMSDSRLSTTGELVQPNIPGCGASLSAAVHLDCLLLKPCRALSCAY
jgi:hypothetical protein